MSGLLDLTRWASAAGGSGFSVRVRPHRYMKSRRGGGKGGIPQRDFQGSVGTVGNRLLVFHGVHGAGFSTALRLLHFAGSVLAFLAGRRVAADHVRPVAD